MSVRTRPTSATLALLLTGGVGLAVYTSAMQRFPLLPNYAIPLQNLDKLTASLPFTGLLLALAILLLFAVYAVGGWAIAAAGGRLSLAGVALLWAVPLIAIALLLFTHPTTSLDIYDYLFRGRMLARYEANTFLFTPQDFAKDPLIDARPTRFVPWWKAVTAYGPLWEGMSWLTARLAGERPGAPPALAPELLRLMLGYKLLGALGVLLGGVALWWALGRVNPRQQALGVFLWLWNPLVLWESVAAAHNDAWMAVFLVLAFGRAAVGLRAARAFWWFVGAFALIILGGLIKYSALFLGPIVLAAALRALPANRERIRLVLAGAAVTLLLVVGFYAPFWEGTATLRNFGDRGTLFNATALATLQAWLSGRGVLGQAQAQQLASLLGLSLLAFGLIYASVRAWQEPTLLVRHGLWLLLWFFIVCNTWFQPWYILWAVALAALEPERVRAVLLTGLLAMMALISYLATTFVLPLLNTPGAGWPPDGARWNGVLTLVIYGVPLLAYALRAAWRRTHDGGRLS